MRSFFAISSLVGGLGFSSNAHGLFKDSKLAMKRRKWTWILPTALIALTSALVAKEVGRNWSYEMEEHFYKGDPEAKTGQARWDCWSAGWWFNFGPTGVRVKFDTNAPRVAKVMYVFPDSPADNKIIKGDEIIGVNRKNFTTDEPFPPGRGSARSFRIAGPRLEVAMAIEESEGNPKLKGILSFTVRRNGKILPVDLQLEQLGYFSPTFPYNCTKSRLLAERAGDWFIEQRRDGKHLQWGPSRMGDWIDLPVHLALMSFGDRYRKYLGPTGSGDVMWSWIGGIRLITAAEKQQFFNDQGLIAKLGEMSHAYAAKSGPSGAYSHKTWYEGAPFQLAFAAGLNALGQALAHKCGADIDEESYLKTRYLLTCKTNEKGNIGYGASNPTPLNAEDARKHLGNIKTSIIRTDEEAESRLVGGSACTTLMHFIDPRDSFSAAFVKRGVRHAMAARWTCFQAHGCGTLTLVYNTLAASIAPLVGEEAMYRVYMDDMKWWLNIARCHNGGWYFDPKIDTEANPHERVHTTASAILMLNAPLRQLSCNGKTLTPAPKPIRKARSISEENQSTLRRSLLATLVKLSDTNGIKPMPLQISTANVNVSLVKAAADGTLTFQPSDSKVTTKFKWDELSVGDQATMAMLVAQLRPNSPDTQALVGTYLEGLGRVEEADRYYEKADEKSREKHEALFDKTSAAPTDAAPSTPERVIVGEVLDQYMVRFANKIQTMAASGVKLHLYLNSQVSLEVRGASEKALTVRVQGNDLQMPWRQLDWENRALLAVDAAKDGEAENMLFAAVFLAAANDAKKSEEYFNRAHAKDAKATDAARKALYKSK